jgi:cysteine desulfurase / selenocysteine lyase
MTGDVIYLDNAATSYPKAPGVLRRPVELYERFGVSPGRGSYDLSVEASELVDQVRRRVAGFFGAQDPERVVFAANATDALNLAIQGSVRPGDHVVATRLEHNSVLRPLHHLRERDGVSYDLVPFGPSGRVDPAEFAAALRPETALAIVCHGSSVLGTVQPVAEIAAACRSREVPLLVDAAQTAGQVPVDMEVLGAAAIAFTGHKAVQGPTGIGGLVVSPWFEPASTRFGGTGVDSQSLVHTQAFPNRLEAGTLNLFGAIGLSEGLSYLEEQGPQLLHHREMSLALRLRAGFEQIDGISVHTPTLLENDLPIVTCTVDGVAAADVGAILDGDYSIAVRTGLHCAPLVHADLGTSDVGAVRFSLGVWTTEEHVDRALAAMKAIALVAGR